jgi:RNA 2',3'-cyclic 3'-phosphodiesterase
MRLFLAVNLPLDVAAHVGDLQRTLERVAAGGGLRWTKAAQAHFTLKFLGEQPEESVRVISDVAREAAKGADELSITLRKLGAFPDAGRPRVLWIGVGAGATEMSDLASVLDALLAEKGFAKEERPFSPHLTLARIKTRAEGLAAARMIEVGPKDEVAAFRAQSFALMQSVSTPDGVKYVPLETFGLAKA